MATGITIRNGSDNVRYKNLDIIDNNIEIDGKKYGIAKYYENYYCYPADENPTFAETGKTNGNLVLISDDIALHQNWGIEMDEGVEIHELVQMMPAAYRDYNITITRNGKPFYNVKGNSMPYLNEAIALVENKLKKNIPIDWNLYDYERKYIGKNVFFKLYQAQIISFNGPIVKLKYTGPEKYNDYVLKSWHGIKDTDGSIICIYDLLKCNGDSDDIIQF